MVLRSDSHDSPRRAEWEQRQIDAERRAGIAAEQWARIDDCFEHVRFSKWLVKRLRETPRIIPVERDERSALRVDSDGGWS